MKDRPSTASMNEASDTHWLGGCPADSCAGGIYAGDWGCGMKRTEGGVAELAKASSRQLFYTGSIPVAASTREDTTVCA